MKFKKIIIQNFKSYKYQEFEFKDGLDLFLGKNANGKCLRGDTQIEILIEDEEISKKFKESQSLTKISKCTLKDITEFYEKYPEFKNKIKVKTRFGFFNIEEAGITAKNSDVIGIILENGNKIFTAPDHRIIKKNNWEFVKNIEINDKILTNEGYIKVVNKINLKEKEDLYDLQVQKVQEYFGNGVVSHNSTIQESLFYCLFGKPFTKIKNQSLINSIHQKELLVTLEFQKDNKDYKIERGMKHSVFKIYENGKLIKERASVKDYQEFLETKILKFNELVYRQLVTVIANLSSSKNFIDLNTREKEEFLENILDVSLFKKLNRVSKETIKDLEYQIEEYKKDLSHLNILIKSEEDKIKQLKEKEEKYIQTKNEQIEYFKNEIKELQEQNKQYKEKLLSFKDIKEKFENLKNSKEQIEKSFQDKQKVFNDKKAELKYLLKAKKDFYICEQCKTKNYIKISKEELDKEESLKEELITLKSDLNVLEIDVQKAQKEFGIIQTDVYNVKNFKEKINQNSDKIIQLENKIKEVEYYKIESYSDEELKKLKQAQELNNEKINVLIIELSNYKKLSDLIFKNQLKEQLIKSQIKELNLLIEYYLGKFELDYSIEIKEDLKVIVNSIKKSSEFYSLSNGEKARVNFALLFAFLRLIEEKNGIQLNVLFLDEALDSSLDYTGKEKLLEILKEFENKNIIVISHSNEIIEKEDFDRVFEITKDDFSKINRIN